MKILFKLAICWKLPFSLKSDDSFAQGSWSSRLRQHCVTGLQHSANKSTEHSSPVLVALFTQLLGYCVPQAKSSLPPLRCGDVQETTFKNARGQGRTGKMHSEKLPADDSFSGRSCSQYTRRVCLSHAFLVPLSSVLGITLGISRWGRRGTGWELAEGLFWTTYIYYWMSDTCQDMATERACVVWINHQRILQHTSLRVGNHYI